MNFTKADKPLGRLRVAAAVAPLILGLSMLAAAGAVTAQTLTKLKAGMVTGIDQVGLPIALERGFFEKNGLDVTVARPYATGVDALNALQAGESEIVQVGVPMIGAVLRAWTSSPWAITAAMPPSSDRTRPWRSSPAPTPASARAIWQA
jgi:ABC-type nitrate/sulfonate/bicarbonate transport system substrate-binding protein